MRVVTNWICSTPLLPQGLQCLPGAVEPGGQIVGRHPQGAALLLGVKGQGVALQRFHMEVQAALPVRALRLPPFPHDGVRVIIQDQVLVVDDVVDVAGGHAADVRLDLLAVDSFTTRPIAAVADGSTGTVVEVLALADRRRHRERLRSR